MLIGASLKMYFSHRRTLEWTRSVSKMARSHPAVRSGDAELFVIPQFPSIPSCVEIAEGTGVKVGAQNAASEDSGPFTGEVSPAVLSEIGCTFVEIGHAERRRLFGESEAIVATKTEAALRNGLTPILCIGETTYTNGADAAVECIRQFESAVGLAQENGQTGDLVVAYEPIWAIGAEKPAANEHIMHVCNALRAHAQTHYPHSTRVIYGGSAGPGMLENIHNSIDGLFLGRFAHDPAAFEKVLDEVQQVHSTARSL